MSLEPRPVDRRAEIAVPARAAAGRAQASAGGGAGEVLRDEIRGLEEGGHREEDE